MPSCCLRQSPTSSFVTAVRRRARRGARSHNGLDVDQRPLLMLPIRSCCRKRSRRSCCRGRSSPCGRWAWLGSHVAVKSAACVHRVVRGAGSGLGVLPGLRVVRRGSRRGSSESRQKRDGVRRDAGIGQEAHGSGADRMQLILGQSRRVAERLPDIPPRRARADHRRSVRASCRCRTRPHAPRATNRYAGGSERGR